MSENRFVAPMNSCYLLPVCSEGISTVGSVENEIVTSFKRTAT